MAEAGHWATGLGSGIARAARFAQAAGWLPGMGPARRRTKGNIASLHQVDPRLITARAAARAELPRFLERAATQEDWRNVALKVALNAGGAIEHIWVSDFASEDGVTFTARLDNEPAHLRDLHLGDRVTFRESQIEDFAFSWNGQGYGYYSVRAVAGVMPAPERNSAVRFLAPEPLPANW